MEIGVVWLMISGAVNVEFFKEIIPINEIIESNPFLNDNSKLWKRIGKIIRGGIWFIMILQSSLHFSTNFLLVCDVLIFDLTNLGWIMNSIILERYGLTNFGRTRTIVHNDDSDPNK